MSLVISAALLLAAQDVTTISPGAIEAIGPKQDDPRALCEPGAGQGIVVQGGREEIGPKQDDPRSPLRVGVLARPGDDNDPKASGGQGGGLAIGPKQDDPRTPGLLAIGPKQDDPRTPGVLARPGDDEDPHALAACKGVSR